MGGGGAKNTITVTDQPTLNALETLWERLDALSDEDVVYLQEALRRLARAVDFEIDFRKR